MQTMDSYTPADPHRQPLRLRKLPEDTYKVHAMRTLLAKRGAKNGKAMLKLDSFHASTHHKWVCKEMSAYRVACNRKLDEAHGTLAIYEDAARLGNPAHEVLLMLGHHADSDQGFVLPPQALHHATGPKPDVFRVASIYADFLVAVTCLHVAMLCVCQVFANFWILALHV